MIAFPAWIQPFAQERALLIVNHVVAAEPAAAARLQGHAGRVVRVRAEPGLPLLGALPAWDLVVTPAGLVETAAEGRPVPDLEVVADLSQPLALLSALAQGRRPALRIEGDAAFASDMAWLIDNLRWDAEEDLSRLVGDAVAHRAMQVLRGLREALRRLLAAGNAPS